jgi:predicted NUDIX family NTP pyrophosphohydrolase
MYRVTRDGGIEVLLVHPGGPFFAKKDAGVWTIPKGMPNEGEELLECAKREFREETGFEPGAGPYLELENIKQKGGKVVHAWAVEGDCDPRQLVSNTVKVKWPPRSGKWATFPEVDAAGWFSIDEAQVKLLQAQLPFLDRIQEQVRSQGRFS